MKYLLDTNICIYAIKGGDTYLDQRLDECETDDLVMSAITLGELEAGFAKSTTPDAARQQAAAVFQAVTVVPFDEAAARGFGRLQSEAPARRGAYERQIAAHAISRPNGSYQQRAGLRRDTEPRHRELDKPARDGKLNR